MRLSNVLGLSLFVAACGSPADSPARDDEKPDEDATCVSDGDCGDGEICEDDACVDGDRNDDVADADALLWETAQEGEINPEGDVDWYAVQADGGEFVRIEVVTEEIEGGLDSVVSVYTEAGKRLAWEDEHPAGEVSGADSMCFAYFPEAGSYYIKVEDRGTFYGSGPAGGPGEAYTLRITEWNSRPVEPDSPQEAGLDFDEVSNNILYSFPVLLGETGDTDWGVFEVPTVGSSVQLLTLANDDESDLTAQVTLRNQDGDEVLSAVDPRADAYAMLPNTLGTRYVLGVTDTSGAGGSTYWTWAFFVVREPGFGNDVAVEPNDTIDTADVLVLEDREPDTGKWYAAFRQERVDAPDDVDVYGVEVAFDEAYVSVIVGAASYGGLLQPRVELLDAAGEVLASADAEPGEDVSAINLGPYPIGSYYLRISAAPESGTDGGEGYYYLFGAHVSSFEFDD